MTFRLMPACETCHRQDNDLPHPLCEDLRLTLGDPDVASKALQVFQEHCDHPRYGSDYEYVPGIGRDHWYWCTTCMKVWFVNPPDDYHKKMDRVHIAQED